MQCLAKFLRFNYSQLCFMTVMVRIIMMMITIHLALKPNLTPPMIMLIFKGAILAVVDSEEWPRNIQVSPNHLISSYFQSAPKY